MHRTLDAAAAALGGKDRVLGIRTLQLNGTGDLLYFGQTVTPYAKTTFAVTEFERSYDFAARRWHQVQLRESRFLKPVPEPLRVRIGLDDNVAYNAVANNPMARASASVAADRAAEFLFHPVGFIQAAYAPSSQVTESNQNGLRRIHLRTGELSLVMDIEPSTHLPRRISRMADHQMLGDVTVQLVFSNWREINGVRFPMRLVQRMERWVMSDYSITRVRINEGLGDLRATEEIRSLDATTAEPEFQIRIDEIAAGVWSLTGPAFNGAEYHTIAIEQSNRIVLVEAPDNDARTLAVIAAAKTLRFGKPVATLVNTHHHFDHAGGVRAAMANEMTIFTHHKNREFFERVHAGRHSIRPDALQLNPKRLHFVSVRDRLVLRDALRTIELYAAEEDAHAGSMLVVYLPGERILIQADMDRVGATGAGTPPIAPALVRTVDRSRLRVERVVGIHGDPVSWNSSLPRDSL